MIRNLKQVIELLAILWCMANLFGKKMKFHIHGMIFLIVNLIIFEGINEGKLPVYFQFMAYLSLVIYSISYYRESIKVVLLNDFLTVVIISILQAFFYLPVCYFPGMKTGISDVKEVLINIGCLGLMMLGEKKFRMEELSKFLLRKNRLQKLILLFLLICMGNATIQVKKYLYLTGKDYILIIFFVMVAFLCVNELQKARIESERRKVQLEFHELYYSAYDELLMLVRERQHDMKNHINAICGMIYTIDNYEDLVHCQKEYCQQIMDKNEETKLLLSVDNPLIAGFLYTKIQEAEKRGIEVEYKIAMEEKDIKIQEYDIVEMLGILLDNAIEALEIVQRIIRKIYVDIICEGKELHISVANSSEEYNENKVTEFFQQGFSSKGKGRGIGLSKLKKIVFENEGQIIVSNETYNDIIYLNFCINIPID